MPKFSFVGASLMMRKFLLQNTNETCFFSELKWFYNRSFYCSWFGSPCRHDNDDEVLMQTLQMDNDDEGSSLQGEILSVCLSFRHHFNISNIGPSNHPRIM